MCSVKKIVVWEANNAPNEDSVLMLEEETDVTGSVELLASAPVLVFVMGKSSMIGFWDSVNLVLWVE